MAALPVGASLMQGEFLDGIVESTLRGLVIQLKAEYRKELSKALDATKPEATCGAGTSRIESPLVALAPPLNAPVTERGEDQLRLAGELRAAYVSGPPLMESAGGCTTCSPPRDTLWLPPEGRAWEDSRTSHVSRTTGSGSKVSNHSAGLPCEETAHTKRYIFTELEQEKIKKIREEEIEKEDAVLARRGSRISALELPAQDMSACRMLAYKTIASPKFDFGMGIVIMLNAVTIGMETSITRQGHEIPVSLHILEYLFLTLYCAELALRIYVLGRLKAFSSHWVKFDAVMVAAGIINFFITVASLGGAVAGVVDNVNMLKMLRLFRLAKTVRVFVQFRTLWLLVQGLMYAVLPMFWTAILMGTVIYVFAVIAVETIHVSGADDAYTIAAHNYDTIGESMLTLMQFMTLDSAAEIYRPLINSRPWLVIYFLVFIMLGPIALMNIVTAIMVESSLRTANEDQEAKKAWDSVQRKTLMPKLKQMFVALDTDASGDVDLEEIKNAPREITEAIQHIVGLDEIEEVFNLMDYDASGSVDIDEFVDGIMRTRTDKPSELFVLMKQNRAILDRLKGLGPHPAARASAVDGAPHPPLDDRPPADPPAPAVAAPGL